MPAAPEGPHLRPARHDMHAGDVEKHAALHSPAACPAPVDEGVLSVQPPTPVDVVWSRQPLTPLEIGAVMASASMGGLCMAGGHVGHTHRWSSP